MNTSPIRHAGNSRARRLRGALLAALCAGLLAAGARAESEKILGDSRIQGGLCVILGAGDGSLAAEFVDAKKPFLVNVLEADAGKVAAARQGLLAKNLYGKASVEQWESAELPYADNLVSLLVVANPGKVSEKEMLRVVRPWGEIMTRQPDGSWKRTVKPWPAGMDEWTHARHGPDGNAVSKDKLVELPERVQWNMGRGIIGERTYAVYANGRLFGVEGQTLVVRDAFNGAALWQAKAKLELTAEQRALGYKDVGMLVAVGERVYFSSPDGKFGAHDAATGKVLTTYAEAGTPLNILCVQDGTSELGTLVVADQNSIRALDANSGRVLWKQEASLVKLPVADGQKVVYITGDFIKKEKVAIVARELASGKVLWEQTDFPQACPWPERAISCSMGYDMLAYANKVPYRWPGGWFKYYQENPKEKKADVVVLSAKTGKVVSVMDPGGSSARHGEWNDALWVNDSLLRTGRAKGDGSVILLNPAANLTAAPKVMDDNNIGDHGFGHCMPPAVTERFYIYGQMSLVDLKTGAAAVNPISRGGCTENIYPGYLPANGLLYTAEKHCVCFPMIDGFTAFAPAYKEAPKEDNPLVQGPAWGEKPAAADYSAEWPTYRHDSYRTSGTDVEAPAKLKVLWSVAFKGPDYADPVVSEWKRQQYAPGPLTQPTVAGGTVFLAQPDTHRVLALGAADGKQKWEFVADGRVDGPPTIYQGMCFFGCRSGWLYNLRASDGQLIWKRRLAPVDRRIFMFGQVESPIAAPGSPVIIDGKLYLGAGLHPQADGGVRMYCIEPATGAIVWQNKCTTLGYEDRKWGDKVLAAKEDPWRRTGAQEYEPFDIPVKDGDSVAVSRYRFDLKTGKLTVDKLSYLYQIPETGVMMRRRAWDYATRREERRAHLAAALGGSVFGDYTPAVWLSNGNEKTPCLYRIDYDKSKKYDAETKLTDVWCPAGPGVQMTTAATAWKVGDEKKPKIDALVVAGKNLFTITGKAGLLEVYSTQDGKKVGELRLGKEPIWDGLAASGGRLYVTTADGSVLCLGQ